MATAPKIKDDKTLTGPQKAAIFMLALGADDAAPLWEMFDEDEIRERSSGRNRMRRRSVDSYEPTRAPVPETLDANSTRSFSIVPAWMVRE